MLQVIFLKLFNSTIYSILELMLFMVFMALTHNLIIFYGRTSGVCNNLNNSIGSQHHTGCTFPCRKRRLLISYHVCNILDPIIKSRKYFNRRAIVDFVDSRKYLKFLMTGILVVITLLHLLEF